MFWKSRKITLPKKENAEKVPTLELHEEESAEVMAGFDIKVVRDITFHESKQIL